ncbi:MAG: hypothetical protein LUG95_08835 [Clostridiales bacterium]|nr:hypothetical protein [Clostridiales bacterium]
MYEYGLDRESFLLAIFLIFLIWCVSMLQEKFMREQNFTIRDELAKQNVIFKWALTYALIFGILIFGVYGSGYDASVFVYGQF